MKVDPLTTQVYDYISKKIQNGEYEANQRITESEICKSIGVSRTPAREALTRLAGENLLEKIPNKGFVGKGEIRHLFRNWSIGCVSRFFSITKFN